MHLTLNVYNKNEVVKTVKSTAYDLEFGTILKLMKLLKVEDAENEFALLKIIAGAFDEIVDVLSNVFPDMTDEDWEHVKMKELVPVIIGISKFSVTETLKIPSDNKKK